MTVFRDDLAAAIARIATLEEATTRLEEENKRLHRAEDVLRRFCELADAEQCASTLLQVAKEYAEPGLEVALAETLLFKTERFEDLHGLYEHFNQFEPNPETRKLLNAKIRELKASARWPPPRRRSGP